ncbi:MAG: type II toxin-antitoxin system PemK/MazF family toxin [Acidiferrobacter sp.]
MRFAAPGSDRQQRCGKPQSVVVVPVSSTTPCYPGEAVVTVGGKSGKAMADQIMAADKARLKNQLSALSKTDMLAVEQAILRHLGLPR